MIYFLVNGFSFSFLLVHLSTRFYQGILTILQKITTNCMSWNMGIPTKKPDMEFLLLKGEGAKAEGYH